jgi:hypothetical protein
MPKKNYPIDTLDQAAAIIAACKQIDPNMKPGMLTQAEFADAVAQAHAIQSQINGLELQLIDLRNKREARLTSIWEAVKRARSSVKGIYGDDSSEYELVGGTRMSERKKAVRKKAA